VTPTPLSRLESTAALLPADNIDTDRIVPARFLTAIDHTGFGRHLFADWRLDADGRLDPDFPLNQDHNKGAEILITGHNFGCGSSREHAVWALLEGGFRALISTAFADIFRSNALRNGLLSVEVEQPVLDRLVERIAGEPGTRLTVDVEAQILSWDGTSVGFALDPFARHCITHGVDELGYLLDHLPQIEAFEASADARVNTRELE